MGIPIGASGDKDVYVHLVGCLLRDRLAGLSAQHSKQSIQKLPVVKQGGFKAHRNLGGTHTTENVGCLRKMVFEKTGDRFSKVLGR